MTRPSLGLTKVNFHIDPIVLDGLKWLATNRGTSYSELLRIAAKQYVVQEIKAEQEDILTLSFPKETKETTAASG